MRGGIPEAPRFVLRRTGFWSNFLPERSPRTESQVAADLKGRVLEDRFYFCCPDSKAEHPVRSLNDLREARFFSGGGESSELEDPELAESLKILGDQGGWQFRAFHEGPSLGGYGAYNLLTESDQGFLFTDHKLSRESLTQAAAFYRFARPSLADEARAFNQGYRPGDRVRPELVEALRAAPRFSERARLAVEVGELLQSPHRAYTAFAPVLEKNDWESLEGVCRSFFPKESRFSEGSSARARLARRLLQEAPPTLAYQNARTLMDSLSEKGGSFYGNNARLVCELASVAFHQPETFAQPDLLAAWVERAYQKSESAFGYGISRNFHGAALSTLESFSGGGSWPGEGLKLTEELPSVDGFFHQLVKTRNVHAATGAFLERALKEAPRDHMKDPSVELQSAVHLGKSLLVEEPAWERVFLTLTEPFQDRDRAIPGPKMADEARILKALLPRLDNAATWEASLTVATELCRSSEVYHDDLLRLGAVGLLAETKPELAKLCDAQTEIAYHSRRSLAASWQETFLALDFDRPPAELEREFAQKVLAEPAFESPMRSSGRSLKSWILGKLGHPHLQDEVERLSRQTTRASGLEFGEDELIVGEQVVAYQQ